MAVGVQVGVGRKEPEKQGKEKKYPHREERRKKTKRMGRDQRKEEARETIKGEGERLRGKDRRDVRGRHGGWGETRRPEDTPSHTLT